MTVVRSNVYQYSLPLLKNFPRRLSDNFRAEGLIVELIDELGFKAYGELSAASVIEHESFSDAKSQLLHALGGNDEIIANSMAPVQWAITSAKSQLNLLKKGQDRGDFSSLSTRDWVSLNALLDASRPDFVDEGMRQHAQGYRVFKIKIGDGELSREIANIRELASIIGRGITLRLDANQKLSLAEAVEYTSGLRKIHLEYVEEPFADLTNIDEFFRLTGITVALDETVLKEEFSLYEKHDAVQTFVLKPSRIGKVNRVHELMNRAAKLGKKIIFSSTYESSVGLAILGKYALIDQGCDMAMGLSTGSFFGGDIINPPMRPFRGKFMKETLNNALENIDLAQSIYCKRL